MPNYSARDMLLRMAEGGSVASANQSVLDFINNNPDASVEAIATQINSSGADLYSLADTLNIDRSIAQEAYDEANALNQTYLDAETRVMGEINANPAAFNAADAYKEILIADAASERGVNVQGALDAGGSTKTPLIGYLPHPPDHRRIPALRPRPLCLPVFKTITTRSWRMVKLTRQSALPCRRSPRIKACPIMTY